jgi:hypothetical protein
LCAPYIGGFAFQNLNNKKEIGIKVGVEYICGAREWELDEIIIYLSVPPNSEKDIEYANKSGFLDIKPK